MAADISIVVPVFNEEENVRPMYNRLQKVLCERLNLTYEIIYVNNCSRDETEKRILELTEKDSGVKLISLSRNFGYQVGISAGIDHARGQAVVLIDGDLQDPPELITELYRKYEKGYDVVYARRKARKGESFLKRLTARVFYRILNMIVPGIEIPLDTGSFRIMSNRVAGQLAAMREKNRFIRGLVSWIGFKQTCVEYERQPRHRGASTYSPGKLMKFALDGITSFSTIPLKLAGIIGSVVSLLGFLYMIYIIFLKLNNGIEVSGWSSLMVVILFLGGLNLLTLGILGEYIGRIFIETKERPLYIIDREIGFEKDDQ